jgi:potassium efflux system protein
VSILWLTASLGLAQAVFAQNLQLTARLIESRMTDLRVSGVEPTDETFRAYESAQSWLRQAASSDRDADNFVDALTTQPQREAEIQLRMDAYQSVRTLDDGTTESSLEELREQIRLTRSELFEAENERDRIDQRLANRETTSNSIHSRQEEIVARLGELAGLDVLIDPQSPPSLDEGRKWSAVAEQTALNAEQRALKARLASQPVRYSALRAERAELAMQIEDLIREDRSLRLASRRILPIVADIRELGIQMENPIFPIAQQLTSGSSELRRQLFELESRLDDIAVKQKEVSDRILAITDRFATARRLVNFASDSDILGELLIAQWEDMQGEQLSVPIDMLPRQVGNTVISRIAHEDELSELASSSSYIDEQLKRAGLKTNTIQERDREILLELTRAQRESLRRLIAVESTYIDVLGQLVADHTRLTELMDDYKAYLGTLILWVPSRPLLWKSDPADIPIELDRLINGLKDLRPGFRPLELAALLLVGLLLFAEPRLRRFQHRRDRQPIWLRTKPFRSTLVALLLTVLRTLPLPLGLVAFGMVFSHHPVQISAALNNTINGLGAVLFVLILMRVLCEGSGVAQSHFGWGVDTCELIYEGTSWLIFWWLPVTAVASFLFMLDDETVVLGRLTLIFSLVLLVAHIVYLVTRDFRAGGRSRLSINPNYVRILFVILLVMLIGGIVWGLRYSVSIMTTRLVLSLWVGVGLMLIHNVLLCWLRVMGRRMQLAVGCESPESESVIEEGEQAMLADISADTTRLLNAVTMAASLVTLFYIWTPLFPALDALARVSLWHSTTVVDGESVTTQITLKTLVIIVFLASVTIYAARKLPALVELVLHSRTRVSSGSRFAVSTLLSYLIVGTGFLAALSALGLRWAQLQWLIAALGIGIGFGLQEIIANFISGLIILFERPIRVGDFVSIGSVDGVVTKIRIRATIIQDRDGKELVVPNKEFITGKLLNWTLTNPHVRVPVPVGIAYGSDVETAFKILHGVAGDHPHVLADPEPQVVFENFGDNSLELTLRCYIDGVEDLWPILSDLRREINRRFPEAGIVISYPQRDIHFDPDEPLRIEIGKPPDA